MTREFELVLAPPNTLARRFQYALLSFSDPGQPTYSLDVDRGIVVFNSENDYIDLVETAVDHISAMTLENVEKCRPTTVLGIDCCTLDPGPALYKQGDKHDRDYLREACLTRCLYTTARGDQVIAWNHSAISYADVVVNGDDIPVGKRFKLPFLSKLTLYSSVRGSVNFDDMVDFHTLGSTLLGGALSLVGRERQVREGKAVNIEFYLIPETPNPAFSTLRRISLLKTIAGRSMTRIAWELSQDLNVGLDISYSLALAYTLNEAGEEAKQVDPDIMASTTLLATIESGRYRPDMRSVIPLSTLLYKTYSPRTLSSIVKLAYTVRKDTSRKKSATKSGKEKSEVLDSLRKTLSECVYSMYLQALGGRKSAHIYHCVRDLTSQLVQDRDVDERGRIALSLARSLVYSLRNDLAAKRG